METQSASFPQNSDPQGRLDIPSGSMAAPAGPGTADRRPAARPELYPKRRAAGRDLLLAGLLLAAFFLLWDAIRWAEGLGLGEAIGLAALLPIALWYLRSRPGRLSPFGWICAALYGIGSLSLAFSGDTLCKLLLLLGLPVLFVLVLLERLALWTGAGLLSRLHDFFFAAFSMSFGRLSVGVWALLHSGAEGSLRSKRNLAAVLGLLCAVPVLLVLIPLLISSDAAFAGMLGSLDWSVALRGLLVLVYAAFTALLLFSLLFSSDRGPKALELGARKGLEPAAVIAFLAAVSGAYVLYLVSQFAYFTDAFRGLLPKDFTVAEYARRGFFEMCAIVTINLGLIVLALGLCRKPGGKLPGAVKGLALFLCVFSLILVATVLAKMFLYMDRFGLTRLRVQTSVFMLFLAAVVIAVGLRLFVKRVPVLKLTVALGAAALIALSLANVDGVVARYNVDAWRSGRLDSLDMKTVCVLGDGAVPALTELAADEDAQISAAAVRELDERLEEFRLAAHQKQGKEWVLVPTDGSIDLRSWSLIRQQAYEALKAYRDR